jgi:hypothetical protein
MKDHEQHIGLKTPSSIQPVDPDKPLPIGDWQQKYERYLDLIGRKATQKRYARALERFLGKHPAKTFAHLHRLTLARILVLAGDTTSA